jgi:hypothetical protein
MFNIIFIYKLLLITAAVLGLTVIAERVSTKTAGFLAGCPLGTAIILFFFGLEISPEFASKSAVYNITGLVATLAFIYVYYKVSLSTTFMKTPGKPGDECGPGACSVCKADSLSASGGSLPSRRNTRSRGFTRGAPYVKYYAILFSSVSAIAGYFIIAWILYSIQINIFSALFITILMILIIIYFLKKIQNVKIENKIKLNFKILLIRAVIATSIILIITGTAKMVGSTWAGLFSSFPTTTFPLILIIHYTYDARHVHTIIKNIPKGFGAIVIYSSSVFIFYPLYGVVIGTLLSLVIASLYSIGYIFLCYRSL